MTRFTLNDHPVTAGMPKESRLLDVLRDEFMLTGTKEGCGEGECGACSVLIDGKLANACLVALGSIEGHAVLTIEGFSRTERFAVLDEAFSEAGAVQCGFCTPGMILAAEALLARNTSAKEAEIRLALSGNLCRCTGYDMIVKAVQLAAEKGGVLWQ